MLVQVLAVTSMNLRSIPQRLGSASVAVFNIVGVVIVFVAVLSIVALLPLAGAIFTRWHIDGLRFGEAAAVAGGPLSRHRRDDLLAVGGPVVT